MAVSPLPLLDKDKIYCPFWGSLVVVVARVAQGDYWLEFPTTSPTIDPWPRLDSIDPRGPIWSILPTTSVLVDLSNDQCAEYRVECNISEYHWCV